jgi:signal transduction histidine kinase
MSAARRIPSDTLLAFGLAIVAQLEIWAIGNFPGPKWLTVPMGVAITLPLAWRRRTPLGVVVVLFGTFLVYLAVHALTGESRLFEPQSVAILAAWVVAVYSAAAYAERVRAIAAGAIGLAFLPLAVIGDPDRALGDITPFDFLFILIPWAAGRVVRHHRLQAARLEELAGRLAAEREERARAAVIEERARIARDLHDEIAHSVTVIAVQADAAEGALARDPKLAREPLLAIRDTARGALGELRRLLGMLREAGEPVLVPQPGLAQLEALVEQTREAGVPVELAVDGQPQQLPAGIDLSAYRIVQEGLTNVRKHAAPAQARVRLVYRPEALDLSVEDDGAGSRNRGGSGHGLIGIRERVALYGGSVEAGPLPGRGFALRATLPLER